MIIFAYIYLGLLVFSALFFIVGIVIEKNFSEDTKIMRWWRKHIVGIAPNDWDI
jgi:hypothetical protein